VFNSYSHFREEFMVIETFSDVDKEIYKAREAQYRPRYPWSGELERVWSNCLVHTSPNVPGKIAYFATVENLRANKTTRTSPEMFLERWLADAPEDIKVAWSAEVMGKLLPGVAFIENDDANGWQNIYDNGPHSCMKGCDLVRAYANPKNNLRLAYYQDSCGVVVNRTIVNKKTMAYARIYGKNAAMFAAALRKLGYHHSGNETLIGEMIYVDYRSCPCCEDQVAVGPFIDCEENFVKQNTDNHEKSEGVIGKRGDRLIYSTDDEGDYRCEGCS